MRQGRDQALATLPGGGVAQSAIGDLIVGQAQRLTAGQAAIGENIQSRRQNSVNVVADLVTAPLGAAGAQAGLAGLQAQLDADKQTSIGEGISGIAEAVIKKGK